MLQRWVIAAALGAPVRIGGLIGAAAAAVARTLEPSSSTTLRFIESPPEMQAATVARVRQRAIGARNCSRRGLIDQREENVMRKIAALLCLGLIGAPPPSPDARLRAIIAPVSQAQLRHTIETLVGFGTRHTLSSQADPKRGIGAALNWAESEFNRYSVACGNCLTVERTSETFSGDRLPAPTKITDVFAIQRGTERPNDVVIIQGHIDSRVTDPMNARSEERRVGKEWRCRLAPEHERRKKES